LGHAGRGGGRGPGGGRGLPGADPGSLPAARTGLPRQRADHHLKTLERHGLVEPVEERREGDMTERPEAGAITA
jgi:DNA-binding transcriptional ArsR family regulator